MHLSSYALYYIASLDWYLKVSTIVSIYVIQSSLGSNWYGHFKVFIILSLSLSLLSLYNTIFSTTWEVKTLNGTNYDNYYHDYIYKSLWGNFYEIGFWLYIYCVCVYVHVYIFGVNLTRWLSLFKLSNWKLQCGIIFVDRAFYYSTSKPKQNSQIRNH